MLKNVAGINFAESRVEVSKYSLDLIHMVYAAHICPPQLLSWELEVFLGILWQEHAKVTFIAFEAPGGIHHCILEICPCANEMIPPSAEVRLVK